MKENLYSILKKSNHFNLSELDMNPFVREKFEEDLMKNQKSRLRTPVKSMSTQREDFSHVDRLNDLDLARIRYESPSKPGREVPRHVQRPSTRLPDVEV